MNCANPPPPLVTALRQLRMRVLDAYGPGLDDFVTRTRGVAHLAEVQHEPAAADVLSAVASKLARFRGHDLRQALYADLDSAQAALVYH